MYKRQKVISDAAALKEADYTVDSWKALQSALTDAKSALNAKESQEKVDKATDELNAAIKALVKNGNQAGSQNGDVYKRQIQSNLFFECDY